MAISGAKRDFYRRSLEIPGAEKAVIAAGCDGSNYHDIGIVVYVVHSSQFMILTAFSILHDAKGINPKILETNSSCHKDGIL
tara:strand:+ start:1282 stop:1527 length:246 start_codon:yes stop_codon:yes gene_type:complete